MGIGLIRNARLVRWHNLTPGRIWDRTIPQWRDSIGLFRVSSAAPSTNLAAAYGIRLLGSDEPEAEVFSSGR